MDCLISTSLTSFVDKNIMDDVDGFSVVVNLHQNTSFLLVKGGFTHLITASTAPAYIVLSM